MTYNIDSSIKIFRQLLKNSDKNLSSLKILSTLILEIYDKQQTKVTNWNLAWREFSMLKSENSIKLW